MTPPGQSSTLCIASRTTVSGIVTRRGWGRCVRTMPPTAFRWPLRSLIWMVPWGKPLNVCWVVGFFVGNWPHMSWCTATFFFCELTLIVGSAGLLDLDVIAGWAWKLLNEDLLLQNYIPYALLNIFMESWNCGFFLGASGEGFFPKAPAKGFSSRIAANFNFPLRVKAPLCKDFSV